MGGHEHHHKSSRSGGWEGNEKLKHALEGLATAKGVSQSRIGAVAKLASHYSKFYKHVVHDIEVFLWKAEVEHRLAGLYAIDAIIRQAHTKNPKDAYVKRFLIRLSDTIAAVKKVPEQFQPKVRHVIEEWQKRGIYTSKQIEDVGGREYVYNGQEERSGNVTPRTSPGKLASLLSIIKQKKEEKEHAGGNQQERPPYDDRYRHQRDDAGAYNHRSYDERRDDQRYDPRDVGGIMGDAPGVPIGGSRMQRDPDDRGDLDDRDPKKARGSRWGPPRLDNPPSNDRPAPIITSLDREGDYRHDNGRSGYGSPRQAPLLQSPHMGPPRHEEWNRNAPSSRGSGAGWPRENVRSPQSGGLVRHNASPYEQGGMQRSPFSGSDDRRSPGNRVPGTSGEVCRNFLAGRCTFGDRCWHMHDPQAASSGGGRSEMPEAKRKTVLCNNYPLGKCRFGDKCRYYLIRSIAICLAWEVVYRLFCIFSSIDRFLMMDSVCGPCVVPSLFQLCSWRRRAGQVRPISTKTPTHGEQAGGRWQPSPSSRQGMEPSRVSPLANPSQARSYGAPQVYNEPHGDRGSREGDSSVSYANAAAPSPGGRRLPPDHQAVSMAPPQGYPGTYVSASSPYGAAGGSTYANQGPSVDQGQGRVPSSVLPSPGSGSQYGDQTTAPTSNAKVLADDDDADTVEPEFTLEYDDDD